MFHSAFEKDTEKVVLLEVKAWYKLLSGSGLKKFCVRSYHQTSFWGAWNIDYENNCDHLKMKGSFPDFIQLHNLVHDFWKKLSQCACFLTVMHACTRSLNEAYRKCGLVVFIDEHRYILTEGSRSFKTFLKENYAIDLDMLNMELNMILIVLRRHQTVRHSLNLKQILWRPFNLSRWWIWQSFSLQYKVFICLCGSRFLTNLHEPRILRSIGIKRHYCEKYLFY